MKRIALVLASAAGLAGFLGVSPLRAEHEEGKGKPGEAMFAGLDLSPEQKDKMTAAQRGMRESMRPLRSELEAAVAKLGDQLEDKAADKELVAGLDRVEKAHKAIRAEEEKFHDAMKASLTPAQRARMVVRMSRMMGGGHPGMGRGGMRPHGGRHHGGDKDDKDEKDRKDAEDGD